MPTYVYRCEKCGREIVKEFTAGKAPKTLRCLREDYETAPTGKRWFKFCRGRMRRRFTPPNLNLSQIEH